jgi:uncharacterized cupredoxin-like copper-binding protein
LLLLALVACSHGGGTAVAITASGSSCVVADTALAAGRTTFRVTNKGSDVTEVYVYAPGDRVVAEKENIGPGTSATFTADLAAGHYQVACKPGQKGDGIRTDVHVTGAGGPATPQAGREAQLEAKDFAYEGLAGLSAKTGETVRFELENKGPSQHEFEVFGPDGKAVGEVGPTDPGKDGAVTLTFATAGTYRYECGLADHAQRGMEGSFAVS